MNIKTLVIATTLTLGAVGGGSMMATGMNVGAGAVRADAGQLAQEVRGGNQRVTETLVNVYRKDTGESISTERVIQNPLPYALKAASDFLENNTTSSMCKSTEFIPNGKFFTVQCGTFTNDEIVLSNNMSTGNTTAVLLMVAGGALGVCTVGATIGIALYARDLRKYGY